VNGEQYVAVEAGWGGVFPLVTGVIAFKSGDVRNVSRVLVFKLGGKASLPPLPEVELPKLNPPASTASAATIHKGEAIFQRYCSVCHGDVAVGGGVLPDLRYSDTLASDGWFYVVLGGILQQNGMVSFKEELSHEDAAAIRAYVIFRANQSKTEAENGAASHQ
jgi:alcohol dehydrogenase (cytochrome c)/quinohemoprotein ethanol dehydrogenase